jgi:hypothetical protein
MTTPQSQTTASILTQQRRHQQQCQIDWSDAVFQQSTLGKGEGKHGWQKRRWPITMPPRSLY